jgi:arsenite methyltransferase
MRWYQRFVAKHLRHPTGIFGRRIARRMNAANFEIYELALTNLEIAADDSLLDIGFGGGPAFRQLCGLVPQGQVAGVDSSATMLRMAAASFPDLITAGRLALQPGLFDRLPFQANRFDKIFTVNTIYFWDDPAIVLGEIVRVAKPGGSIAIGYRTPDAARRAQWQPHGFIYRSNDEIRTFLETAGLAEISFAEQTSDGRDFACALARKPS